jgi:hypothetical protein
MTREDKTMIKVLRVLRGKKDVPEDKGVREDTPRWVWWFTDVGRPLAAIVVLVLCAPGEQHLAELSGWPSWLSWGMAGLFSMYAGIAAVVATVRPKGSPGKSSAVWGAVVSLLLAMGAQPVSHLFVTGWLSAEPRAPWILIVTVSCVPPFILGHLLHLAASPVSPRTKDKSSPVPVLVRGQDKDVPEDKGTQWVFEDKTYRAGVPVPAVVKDKDKAVSLIAKAFDVPEDILRAGTEQTAAPVPVSSEDKDRTDVPEDTPPVRPDWLYGDSGVLNAGDTMSPDAYHHTPDPVPVSPPREDRRPVSQGTGEDELSSRRRLPDLIQDIRARVGDNPDAIKDAVLMTPGFEDMRSTPQKRNTLNTAVRRALRKTA